MKGKEGQTEKVREGEWENGRVSSEKDRERQRKGHREGEVSA